MAQETEITTMSEKGQVVIPQKIRKSLRIKAKTKFLVYEKKGIIIMKTFEVPNIEKERSEIFKTRDDKKLAISKDEINEEIQRYRKKK